jgi:hypothetical protein
MLFIIIYKNGGREETSNVGEFLKLYHTKKEQIKSLCRSEDGLEYAITSYTQKQLTYIESKLFSWFGRLSGIQHRILSLQYPNIRKESNLIFPTYSYVCIKDGTEFTNFPVEEFYIELVYRIIRYVIDEAYDDTFEIDHIYWFDKDDKQYVACYGYHHEMKDLLGSAFKEDSIYMIAYPCGTRSDSHICGDPIVKDTISGIFHIF